MFYSFQFQNINPQISGSDNGKIEQVKANSSRNFLTKKCSFKAEY